MKFKTSDGISLDYTDQGTGYPVVFVTGFGGYKEIWTLQVRYLLEMGYRVVTYDHRNQGASQRVKKNDSFTRLILDLRELIQYLQLEKPILVGHSMGASICYGYIAKFRQVAGIIGVDQTPKMLNTATWPFGFMNATATNYKQVASREPRIKETLHGLNRDVLDRLLVQKNRHPFERSRNIELLEKHFTKDWVSTLNVSEIPVLLIAAIQSPYYDAKFVDAIAQVNKNVYGAKLNNCGHVIMAELPKEFNQLLRHFVLKNRHRQVG
ncbi:alpha/beta fold hydrolase [Pediococcus cellicola]|nr:alpha/beta hydrolase [Pediococcus cellicola]GEL15080.1 alpha/beta hydrolase [Pediococcus cellicola]